MDNEYYILEGGERIGPFSAHELMKRPLEPGDVVLLPSQTQGVPAHSMPEFSDYFKLEGIYYPTKENTAAYLLRLPAFLIDMVLLIFGISFLGSLFLGAYMAELEKVFTPGAMTDPEQMKLIVEHHQTELIVIQLVVLVVMFLYNSGCEASRMRGSVGKYVFGLAVVDSMGYSLPIGQAMLRNIGKLSYELPSFFVGILSYFLNIAMIWNPMHQALHDRISGCFVVKKSR